jgi:glycosyltransferase involved in cell wall biosynthesis
VNRPLKILHICSSRAWGGGEMSAVKLAKSFQDRGHKIFFAAHSKGKIIEECRLHRIQTFTMQLLRNIDPLSSFKIRKTILKYKIDIVHVHLSRDLVHVYLSLMMMPNPPRIILQKQVSSKVIKKDLLHRLIYSRVSKIFVLSNFLRDNILDTCPVNEKIVSVIPGGINEELYNVEMDVRSKIRKELGIPEDVLVIGSITRIDRAKGLTELVNAFASLPVALNKCRLVIVGEPTYNEEEYNLELKQLIKDCRIDDRVIFTGYRKDIPQLLSAFDIFALPSYEEAFGYVYIEAMAAGLPVIATNSGGALDVISNGETGFLIPPKDIVLLKDALTRLLSDHQLRKDFGVRSKKMVHDKFSESDILKRYEVEYYSLHA